MPTPGADEAVGVICGASAETMVGGGGEVKVATVEVEAAVDNMATLPVARAQHGGNQEAEKNNAANKEMELRKVQPKPDKR